MPPKSRGRAGRGRGGRGRGTGREASSTGLANESAVAQDQLDASAATEPLPAVPKPDGPSLQQKSSIEASIANESLAGVIDKEEAPPVHADGLQSQESALAASSSTAALQTAEGPARQPRQRLDSLQNADAPARSAAPLSRRGSSTRGKKGLALPTFTGRRSKAERDARNQEAAQRERARNMERDALAKRKQRESENAAKRDRDWSTRGRGGYASAVSGPFSMHAAKSDKRSAMRPPTGLGGSGSGAGSSSRPSRPREDGEGGAATKSSASVIKREEGYVSSDDEEYNQFPRKDIDFIEISSDEEAAVNERAERGHLPVRIGRREHKDRVVGINTDASSEAAKALQHAELGAAEAERNKAKGKGKARDVEITGERAPYKGMWQDSEDTDAKIKSEPLSDNENMSDAVQVGIEAPRRDRRIASPDVERKVKVRVKNEPHLQTDEDRAEWNRILLNLDSLKAELGPEEADASGDMPMADAGAPPKPSVRDNHVYLFQLPPILPELNLHAIKKEPSEAKIEPEPTVPKNEPVVIKKEEDTEAAAKASLSRRFTSGHLGKLRVRASGRTTIDWGGTSYELIPGKQASFLQEVVAMNVVPEDKRVAEEDAGEAVSLGRVKGKFVATLDFAQTFS